MKSMEMEMEMEMRPLMAIKIKWQWICFSVIQTVEDERTLNVLAIQRSEGQFKPYNLCKYPSFRWVKSGRPW